MVRILLAEHDRELLWVMGNTSTWNWLQPQTCINRRVVVFHNTWCIYASNRCWLLANHYLLDAGNRTGQSTDWHLTEHQLHEENQRRWSFLSHLLSEFVSWQSPPRIRNKKWTAQDWRSILLSTIHKVSSHRRCCLHLFNLFGWTYAHAIYDNIIPIYASLFLHRQRFVVVYVHRVYNTCKVCIILCYRNIIPYITV